MQLLRTTGLSPSHHWAVCFGLTRASASARWLGLYGAACAWVKPFLGELLGDNFGPQNAVPDCGERMIDFTKLWFSKICCWDLTKLLGANLEVLMMYKIWVTFSRTPNCGVAFLPWDQGRGYEAPKGSLQKYSGKHYSSAGIPSNSWNDFAQTFICLNSSLFPLNGWRNERDAKSKNELSASPFPKFQSLFCSLNCNIAARGPKKLHVPGLNKSMTICNSANSLSHIGNRLNKLLIWI